VTHSPIAIRTEDLSVTFGQPVLRNVSISIEAGEFVALMGANGTGKTTLVRAAMGLTRRSHGRSWLCGTPIEQFHDWQRVAYVPQRLVAASAVPLSVEEAVRSALASPRNRWRPLSREQRRSIHDALDHVGLADRHRDRLEDLSGGQQRRVMVARALVTGADLLILDEPTAGVDQREQSRLAEHIRHMHAAGATIVLITHDLGPVASLATRAIVLGQPNRDSVRYDGPTPPPAQWTEHVWHHSHEGEPDPGVLEGP
jgi:zinc transport system ATP-binding protein